MTTRLSFMTLPVLFLPVLLAAQALTDVVSGESRLLDSQSVVRPGDALESHIVKRGDTVWFGKSRNKIVDYADVTTKTGTVTTDHRTGRHYDENTTRYKLSVVVETPGSSTATANAKVREIVRYTETSSVIDVLVELQTGIEGSSSNFLDRQQVLSATIVTSQNMNAEWMLRMETTVDYVEAAWHGQGTLAIGDRSIDVISYRLPLQDTNPFPGIRTEFVENGRMLSSIGDGVYRFDRDLDHDLKLVLATAMEVVNFRMR